MVFTKPFEQIDLNDIVALQTGKIHESDILDYKKGMIDDDGLVKHISAFANTQGGLIIFGIEETGPGGYPKDICGIDGPVNHERIEQIVLSNVTPRLVVRIRSISNTPRGNSLLLLEIPDSHLKPHMNLRSKKFYRRYNFEATEMTETEVSEAYKRRFGDIQGVSAYVERVFRKHGFMNDFAHFVIQPTVINPQLIDTSRPEEFKWLVDPTTIDPKPILQRTHFTFLPGPPEPSRDGVLCESQGILGENEDVGLPYLELHRNGAVEYATAHFATPAVVPWLTIAVRLMHLLQFASIVYSRYNYFGDVRIAMEIRTSRSDVALGGTNRRMPISDWIRVEREFPSTMLSSGFSPIVAGMMHQLFNRFGLWRCELFDNDGQYDEKALQ